MNSGAQKNEGRERESLGLQEDESKKTTEASFPQSEAIVNGQPELELLSDDEVHDLEFKLANPRPPMRSSAFIVDDHPPDWKPPRAPGEEEKPQRKPKKRKPSSDKDKELQGATSLLAFLVKLSMGEEAPTKSGGQKEPPQERAPLLQEAVNTPAAAAADRLLPHHRKMLADSGISPEVINARGYWSATKKAELKDLGFSDAQCRVPALVIPIFDVTGQVALHQIRPDVPRANTEGKPVKYETPRNAKMVLDIPPAARPFLGNPSRPLFITEGIKKADSAVSHGLCCVALLGVWNFRGTNEEGGKTALAAWESIALADREVYIVFDSDVSLKPEVHKALSRLKGFLESRKANVRAIYLPPRTDGSKVGLDDFFAAGGVAATLLAHATDKLRKGPEPDRDFPYRETSLGLLCLKQTREGVIEVPLCNFTARIITECEEDDGIETRRTFEIAVRQGERTATVRIPWEKFNAVNWSTEAFGADAAVVPGPMARDHIRFATQLFSQGSPKRKLYAHLGWRKIGEQWVYLHAGGAIGAEGAVECVEMSVPASLERYKLPSPPSGEDRKRAIQASLRLLRVAPLRVTAPIYTALWRAPLGGTDFSVHVAGETGQGKTAVVTCALQHHGAEFSAKTLPGSWGSTANSLEALAFTAKDSLLVIDDFCPTGSATDIQRSHREADRILRAQGNSAGRLRMRADTTLRPAKPPRGTILSTGEDVPRGHSLRARQLIVEHPRGCVDWPKLTGCQTDAAAGLYAQAFAAFVSWLAPQYETLAARVKEKTETWRISIASGHKRTSEITASLAAGFELFLEFGLESAAITEEECAALWKEVYQALVSASVAQDQHHAESDPAKRFLELLTSALSSGRAHFSRSDGGAPEDLEIWGWESSYLSNGERITKSHGEKVGWVEEKDVYLDPEASYAVTQRLQRDQNEALPVTAQTLRKRLKEKGYLASFDVARETSTVRRVLEGKTRQVLHLEKSFFLEGLYPHKKPDIPDICPQGASDHPQVSETTPEKPDISDQEPDIPDIHPTLKNQDKSNSYAQNVGNVGFFAGVESLPHKTKNAGLFEGKTDVGNVGSSQNQNPTSANQNPTFAEEEAEWER